MSKTKPAAKAAPKKAAAKPSEKVTAKKEFAKGDKVNYHLTESESEQFNRPYPDSIEMEVERIFSSGEHLLKGSPRNGDSWQTGSYYSKDKKPGTFN